MRPVAFVSALDVELAGPRGALRKAKLLQEHGLRAWVGLAEPAPGPRGLEGEAPRPAPRTVVAAALGIGQRRVEASLAALFAQWEPAAVVLVGVAGGCTAEARGGSLYLCDPMIVEPPAGPNGMALPGREPRRADRSLVEAALRAGASLGAEVRVGTSVTVNVLAATPAVKDSLWRNRGAHVVEMENFWAAKACAERGVPFLALRAVFDGPADPLPVVPGLGEEPLWRVLRRNPRAILHLPRLGLRMAKVKRALDPLARAMVGEVVGTRPAGPGAATTPEMEDGAMGR